MLPTNGTTLSFDLQRIINAINAAPQKIRVTRLYEMLIHYNLEFKNRG